MKNRISGLLFLCFIVISVLTGCTQNLTRKAKALQVLETGVSSPNTIEELEQAIEKYEERIVDITSSQAQVGIWYKILGSRYLEQKMYGEALKCYQKAIEFYPVNQNLYYYVGVCAGYMANASLDYNATGNTTKRNNYLKLSEQAYLQAIKIDGNYARALYGLGVLYTFEMNRSADAIPYVEKLLTVEKRHTDGMFLLANAYCQNGMLDEAVELYDKIESIATSEEKKAAARTFKKGVLDAQYN